MSKYFLRYGLMGTFMALAAVPGWTENVGLPQSSANVTQIKKVEDLVVKGEASRLTADLTSAVEMVTREDIAQMNAINMEDSFKYMPNINVRKRYIGDTNGVLQVRGISTWQTTRSMVFADGLPLHYHLQTRFDGAPRWNLVSPDEIAVTEIVYGPFQAEYSGSSMGGVVNVETTVPKKRMMQLESNVFKQKFSYYGNNDDYDGYKASLTYGDVQGPVDYYLYYNHLNNESQPMTFMTDVGPFTAAAAQTQVTGAFRDFDPIKRPQMVIGDSGADDLTNDLMKFKLGYRFNPDMRLHTTIAFNQIQRDTMDINNYLRDAAGNTIWGDNNNSTRDAQFGGEAFNVRNSNFGVSRHEREDMTWGLGLDSKWDGGWSQRTIVSMFDMNKNEDVNSNFNPSDPRHDSTGTIRDLNGTGWKNADIKLSKKEFFSQEKLDFHTGVHWDENKYESSSYSSTNWAAWKRDKLTESNQGTTTTKAVYAQLDWRFIPKWTMNFGGRQEWWDLGDGFKNSAGKITNYPDRDDAQFSPKYSLQFEPDKTWLYRYSIARAYRFPIGEELFGSYDRINSIVNADPNLRTEKGLHQNFMTQYSYTSGSVRMNIFQDDVKDTIFSQSDITFIPTVTTFRNVDRVMTRGVDLAWNHYGFCKQKLDLGINGSYNDAEIRKNTPNPALVGHDFHRIPNWRFNTFATYRITKPWAWSLGSRYSSKQFNRLENDDEGSGWGAVDEFFVVDTKTTYQCTKRVSLGMGVDNIFNKEYFVAHPYPQRTYFLEGKWTL